MVLSRSSFVSTIVAAGDDASFRYSIVSPPPINLTLYGSALRGIWSQTMFAYVILCFLGIMFLCTKAIVCVPLISLLPFDSRPNSFEMALF